MSKGNQVAEPSIKETKVPDFDALFEESKGPLTDAASWNNELDGMLQGFRKLGREIRANSSEDAPPVIGDITITIEGEKIHFTITKDGSEVDKKALGTIKEYKAMCEKKCTKLAGRLKALHKLEGCENAAWGLHPENPLIVVLQLDSSAAEQHKDAPGLTDLRRSLLKLNDRLAILDEQLHGPVTVAETVSGIFHSLKDELKKKGQEFKVAIDNGFPKIDGIPESVEDLVPSIIAKGWELFNKLLDFLKQLLSDIPALVEKIQELFKSASEFPGKLKEAASGLNMGPAEMMKTTKNIKHNVGELKNAPGILKALASTCQDTALQVATAAEQAAK